MIYDVSQMDLEDLIAMRDKFNLSPGLKQAVLEEIIRKTPSNDYWGEE